MVALILAVCGLVSSVVFPFITYPLAIGAVIFAIIGLSEIKQRRQKGKGLAISSIILSLISFILPIIVAFVSFSYLIETGYIFF
ncbi:protein of unknown function [Amphibacillus marinus]|uniref:DUF4190 domain-containing protein n=1 Tax=Amphibacillus marinus TaxID=872970 RepID=A0A1H8GND6_9BACI|nr:DUF4190 domain-containing protein [Amphibacillus marinus]SEN45486.1 protein of unknown function [Amphibacillus marinus]